MTTILITIPFFAVIACGFFATRRKILNSEGRAGLNHFVYYFALPVLTFSLMAQSDLRGEFEWSFVAAYGSVAIVLFSISMLIALYLFRLESKLSVIFATACIYGNTGYFGLPFVIVAFGQDASVPIIICTTFDLAVMLPLASVLVEKAKTNQSLTIKQVFNNALRSIVRNPILVAVALGALFSLLGLQMPETMNRFVVLLGSAAAPCALFALGSSLDENVNEFFKLQILIISAIKLVVHPLLVWLFVFHVFSINDIWARSAVIAASMPVAVTVYILAQQYHTYIGRTSASILLSTIISVATLTFILNQLV